MLIYKLVLEFGVVSQKYNLMQHIIPDTAFQIHMQYLYTKLHKCEQNKW